MTTHQSYTTPGLDADVLADLAELPAGQRRRAQRVQVKTFAGWFRTEAEACTNDFLATIPADDVLSVDWQTAMYNDGSLYVCVVVYREWREVSR